MVREWLEISVCGEGRIGRSPEERSVEELLQNGLIILDKWRGPTSRDVVTVVKNLLGLKKAGHAGTLDPPASGILTIVTENATKVIPALQGMDKEYVGVFHLHGDVSDEKLRTAMQLFVGEIRQKPPVRAAVLRKERMRRVYDFSVIERSGRNILFRAKVEAGTYIRKLCSDLGENLKTGAHLSELRRTIAGYFSEDMACTAYQLEAAWKEYKSGNESAIRKLLLPVERAVDGIKAIVVKDSALANITNGSPVFTVGLCKAQRGLRKGDKVAILSQKGELVALGYASMSAAEMKGRHGLAVRVDRVAMQRRV
jgi:H/ACA ribonucleoprotein complex subunit 4